jgi:hypothetical protein
MQAGLGPILESENTMKMRITHHAGKSLAVCLMLCGFIIPAHAQSTLLPLKNGKATVRKIIQPKRKGDAHFYLLKLRKGQTVEIKVVSNSLHLSGENECGMYFELFDGKGEQLFLGDTPDGIERWEGVAEEAGDYKIKVYMNCLEGFTTADLRKKKPTFNYSLTVQLK